MLLQTAAFVLDSIFHLFILAALVRFWMQVLRAPARNPIAQFTMALTDFAVKPLRRLVPGLFGLDLASFLVALAGEFLLQVILLLMLGADLTGHPEALSPVLFLAFVKLIRLSIYIVMGAVLLQAILSWVNPHHPVAPFFDALTRPFLRPVQRVIPPVGGIDLTPMVVMLICYVILMLPVTWMEGHAFRLVKQALL